MKDELIDSDKHYDPTFWKFASTEIIEKYYPLIGKVVSSFNSLEDDVSEDLVSLINQEDFEIGWIIVANMQFSSTYIYNPRFYSYI